MSNRIESEHLTGRAVLAHCNAGAVAIGYVDAAVGVDYDATACPAGLRLALSDRPDAVLVPAADCDGRRFDAIVCQVAIAGRVSP